MILIYIDMCIDTESLSLCLSLCSICILPDSKFLFDQQLTIILYNIDAGNFTWLSLHPAKRQPYSGFSTPDAHVKKHELQELVGSSDKPKILQKKPPLTSRLGCFFFVFFSANHEMPPVLGEDQRSSKCMVNLRDFPFFFVHLVLFW